MNLIRQDVQAYEQSWEAYNLMESKLRSELKDIQAYIGEQRCEFERASHTKLYLEQTSEATAGEVKSLRIELERLNDHVDDIRNEMRSLSAKKETEEQQWVTII